MSISLAVDWPWGKPDEVTAQCTLDPQQIERGSVERLHAKAEATDSRGHKLSYGWSANGGKVEGKGPETQVDASELNPGVYSVLVVAQDGHKHEARCVRNFQVVRPPDRLTIACSVEPQVVTPGTPAELQAQAADSLGHVLQYRWVSNAGYIEGTISPSARLDTTGLPAGVYTVTGRVEDAWGQAADCVATVEVRIPPPPPEPALPPEPENIAQILFSRNLATLGPAQEQQLQKVLTRLEAEPAGRISIESYAAPDENQPQKLAAERAEIVRQYLAGGGIAASRIRTLVGLGGRLGGLRNRTLDIIWLPEGLEY